MKDSLDLKYKAIIFDFDGVIGRTMEDNYKAWSKAFSNHNIFVDREEYFLLEGRNVVAVAEKILEINNMNVSLALTLVEQKEHYYRENNHFEFYPGMLQILAEVQSYCKIGLVSGASARRLKQTVPSGFFENFSAVVTGDSLKNSKPHPEPYLVAGQMLSVAVKNCLAVENAPLGIESAKLAGMDCVAVCSTLKREHLSKADIVVDDIDSLVRFLKKIKR